MSLENVFRSSALFCIYRLHLHTVIVSLFKISISARLTNSDSEDHKAEQRDDFELTGVTRLQGK